MKLNRSAAPEVKGKLVFHLPEIKQFQLNNGLKVLFVEKDNLPIIQMSLVVNAGSRFDPPGKNGLAYLTSMLIDEGAGEYSALELDNEIESLGSIFGVSTDRDLIYINMLSIKDKFERSLELLTTVYTSPLFTDSDFEREKKKLLTMIIRNYDEPSYIASTNFRNLVYNTTPYDHPIIGTLQEIETIDNNDVKHFYRSTFSPSNSHLIVVGSITMSELEKKLNKYFTTISFELEIKNNIHAPIENNSNIYFIHKQGAAQSEIRVGHISNKRTDSDYFAKAIMNSILGGQFSSRLNLNLREDKGFTYGVSSGFYYNKFFSHFQIATSVESKNTGETIKEIEKEINGIKQNISIEEIDFAKSYLIKRFPAMFETYTQTANNLTSLIHYSLDRNYFNNYIQNIENCTKDEIEEAARMKIVTDKMIYVIVGDGKKVLFQLRSISDSNIIELDKFGEIETNENY
ncbi:hypothetical protein MNBD_IGNAVI01-1906 [hydrothermal vent metagenome]|uniref:Insulinase family protein n=1 Tax=hydrothermal vent metagenome TaxID=652676 RepID=A0A3B1CDV2_9ZZZZ